MSEPVPKPVGGPVSLVLPSEVAPSGYEFLPAQPRTPRLLSAVYRIGTVARTLRTTDKMHSVVPEAR